MKKVSHTYFFSEFQRRAKRKPNLLDWWKSIFLALLSFKKRGREISRSGRRDENIFGKPLKVPLTFFGSISFNRLTELNQGWIFYFLVPKNWIQNSETLKMFHTEMRITKINFLRLHFWTLDGQSVFRTRGDIFFFHIYSKSANKEVVKLSSQRQK